MADWSNLPKDLLEQISNRLDTSTDLLRFRSVCTTFRSSALPRPPRWRILPNDGISKASFGFHLSKRTVFLIGLPYPNDQTDPGCWLVKIEEKINQSKQLLNPLSRYKLNSMPIEFPQLLNLIDFRICEMGFEYVLHNANCCKLDSGFDSLYMEKVVVLWLDCDKDYVLLTIHVSGKLAIFRNGDKRWRIINDMPSPYDDVVVYKGRFFAVDNTGRTVVVRLDAGLGLVANPVFGGDKKYLVESRGDLLLVDMYLSIDTGEGGSLSVGEEFLEHLAHYMSERTVSFRVYRLDEEGKSWVEMSSLGDQVLFVGDDSSFSASASDLRLCKGNCIFFVDNFFYSRDSPAAEDERAFAGPDLGVFELENGCIGPLGNYPQYSKLFWPPPRWVTSPLSEVQN